MSYDPPPRPQQPGYSQQPPGYPPGYGPRAPQPPGYGPPRPPAQSPGYGPRAPQQQPPAPYSAMPRVAAGERPRFGALWKQSGPVGYACSVGGLLLFCSFFFPWFSTGELCRNCFGFNGYSDSGNAFTVAQDGVEGFRFALLALVMFLSLVLMILPPAAALGRVSARRAYLVMLGVVGAALLAEIGYTLSALGALRENTGTFSAANTTITVFAGPDFGLWLALALTLALLGCALYGWTRRRA